MTGERGDWNIAGYLERATERFPERVAVCLPGGSSLTYRQLRDSARRVAGFLADAGVSPGDRVGIVLPKSPEAVCAIYGTLMAGAAYVPLDFMAPARWVGSALSDCGCQVAIVDSRCRELVADIAARMKVVLVGEEAGRGCQVGEHYSWSEVLRRALAANALTRAPDDLAYILYTSGSTGQPKGVMLSHRNAATFVDWCVNAFGITEHDRFGSHAPFCFSISIFDQFVCINAGATLCLVPEEMGKNPRLLVKFVADEKISVWKSTPSILSLIVQFGKPSLNDLASLRLVTFAGGTFPAKFLRQLMTLVPHAAVFNCWGATEINPCLYARVPAHIEEDKPISCVIGYPGPYCSTLVLDDEGEVVAPGSAGMLHVSGATVTQGYWNRPAETEAAFVIRHQQRWYRTGDIVRYDPNDGFIYIGRRDRMVKRRGNRIELGEIERALFAHPGLHEVAVIALPDSEEGVRIAAFVVATEPAKPSIIELRIHCANELPLYMTPDYFVFLDSLPRTSTGKTDYPGLKAIAQARS